MRTMVRNLGKHGEEFLIGKILVEKDFRQGYQVFSNCTDYELQLELF